MGRRIQARIGNGRFTRNTFENTLGLHSYICPGGDGEWCGAIVTWPVGTEAPDACHRCGRILVRETCAHGRCTEPFMDPFVFRSGGYTECGKPAVAVSIECRWGECEEHAQKPEIA